MGARRKERLGGGAGVRKRGTWKKWRMRGEVKPLAPVKSSSPSDESSPSSSSSASTWLACRAHRGHGVRRGGAGWGCRGETRRAHAAPCVPRQPRWQHAHALDEERKAAAGVIEWGCLQPLHLQRKGRDGDVAAGGAAQRPGQHRQLPPAGPQVRLRRQREPAPDVSAVINNACPPRDTLPPMRPAHTHARMLHHREAVRPPRSATVQMPGTRGAQAAVEGLSDRYVPA